MVTRQTPQTRRDVQRTLQGHSILLDEERSILFQSLFNEGKRENPLVAEVMWVIGWASVALQHHTFRPGASRTMALMVEWNMGKPLSRACAQVRRSCHSADPATNIREDDKAKKTLEKTRSPEEEVAGFACSARNASFERSLISACASFLAHGLLCRTVWAYVDVQVLKTQSAHT